jgi:hypothetical protein
VDTRKVIQRVLAITESVQGLWYHGGSRDTFDDHRMDRDRTTQYGNYLGPGIYLTRNRDQALQYAHPSGYLHTIQIKPGARILEQDVSPHPGHIRRYLKLIPEEDRQYGLSNFDKNPSIALSVAVESYSIYEDLHTALLVLDRDFTGLPDYGREFAARMTRFGYDAFRHTEPEMGIEYLVVWNPEIMNSVQVEPYSSSASTGDAN